MFQSTRIKLTAWYLIIIMTISLIFSIVIYIGVTNQIEGFMRMQNDRIRNFQVKPLQDKFPPPGVPPMISLEDLKNQKEQLLLNLFLVNLGILVAAGGAAYFLAGRTLRPIKLMIDEQNQFISDASHELRTPIATMRAEMEASLLEKQINDDCARKLIKSNLEELGNLQDLANNLLKLNQAHTLREGKPYECFSLLDAIQIAKKQILPLADEKKIVLKIQTKDVILKVDKERFIQVLVIILDNAIKYSQEKTEVEINSQVNDKNIQIMIRDQGIGIEEKDSQHIFKRFYRADKSRSLTTGYGLGLSIAKTIMEMHQGTISFEKNKKRGTKFILHLPSLN